MNDYKYKNVCSTSIESALWSIEDYVKAELNKDFRFDENPRRFVEPLCWWISTGRAPTDFLRILVNTGKRQHSAIARRLIKSGTHDDAINSVCGFLKFKREY